jgi:cell division protein FtsZ
MSNAGSALMGIGSARGEDRAVVAAEHAISSPLLEASMDGAQGVLLSIAGGSDLGLFEINEAASLVQEAAHPEANIIFGTVIDDSLGDEVRVTVIAAGFEAGTPTHKKLEPTAFGSPAAQNGRTGSTAAPAPPAPPTAPASTGFGHSAHQSGTLPPAAPYSPPPPRTPEVARREVSGFGLPPNVAEPPAATLPPAPPTSPSMPAASSTPPAGSSASGSTSGSLSSTAKAPVADPFDPDDDVDVPSFMKR